jgi:hypothetical protein
MRICCSFVVSETVKIPTYLAGIGRLAATGVSYDITSINSTSSPTTGRSVLSIFPGKFAQFYNANKKNGLKQ